jgi:hypothetical protein
MNKKKESNKPNLVDTKQFDTTKTKDKSRKPNLVTDESTDMLWGMLANPDKVKRKEHELLAPIKKKKEEERDEGEEDELPFVEDYQGGGGKEEDKESTLLPDNDDDDPLKEFMTAASDKKDSKKTNSPPPKPEPPSKPRPPSQTSSSAPTKVTNISVKSSRPVSSRNDNKSPPKLKPVVKEDTKREVSTKKPEKKAASSDKKQTEPDEKQEPESQDPPTMEQLRIMKLEMLTMLAGLKAYGIELSQDYDMDSDYGTMKAEYDLHRSLRDRQKAVGLYEKIMMTTLAIGEYANEVYNPFTFKIKGYSKEVSNDITTYREIFADLHDKYKDKNGKTSPEMRLLTTLMGGAVNYHMGQMLLGTDEGAEKKIKEMVDKKVEEKMNVFMQRFMQQQQMMMMQKQQQQQYQQPPPRMPHQQPPMYYGNPYYPQRPQQTAQRQPQRTPPPRSQKPTERTVTNKSRENIISKPDRKQKPKDSPTENLLDNEEDVLNEVRRKKKLIIKSKETDSDDNPATEMTISDGGTRRKRKGKARIKIDTDVAVDD